MKNRKLFIKITPPKPEDDPEYDIPFNPDKCPRCCGVNLDVGFGLASGGYGPYEYCLDCSWVFNKSECMD